MALKKGLKIKHEDIGPYKPITKHRKPEAERKYSKKANKKILIEVSQYVQPRVFQALRVFFKKAQSSITKMTQQPAHFLCFVTMINMKTAILNGFGIVGRLFANHANPILSNFDFFEFFTRKSVIRSYIGSDTIFSYLRSVFVPVFFHIGILTNFAIPPILLNKRRIKITSRFFNFTINTLFHQVNYGTL